MAKESTAVANLLELMAQKPIDRYSEDDMLFAGPAKATRARPRTIRPNSGPKIDETFAVTHRVRRVELNDLRKPLLIAAIIVGGAAASLAIYKAARGSGGRSAPAAALAAAAVPTPAPDPTPAPPPPAPAPIVVEAIAPPKIVAPPPAPALVDLTLESRPAGATVTIANRIAGTTPLAMSLDPAHEVDVTFSLDGQEPKTIHVDPKTMKKVTVELAVVEPEAPAPAAVAHKKAATTGSGTLMVSTKPPCEIAIDGKSTGLISPQRSITVAAGHHQVTFTNTQQHIKKTVAVAITANHSTKLIRDLMK